MVGPSADHSYVDAVIGVPSCKPIDYIDTVPCVQIIDRSFSVYLPDLRMCKLVPFHKQGQELAQGREHSRPPCTRAVHHGYSGRP